MDEGSLNMAAKSFRYMIVVAVVLAVIGRPVAAQSPRKHFAAQSVQAQVQQYQQRQKERIEQLKLGVVRVVVTKGEVKETGTGFIVSSSENSALIVTALHVVQDATSISVVFYSDQMKLVPARKLSKHSSSLDLAVLEVSTSLGFKLPPNLPKYSFASNDTLSSTEHMWSVNGEWTIVSNNITQLSYDGDPQRFEYSNISVGEGFSGGPIFDDYQDVIGIHLGLRKDEKFAIAVKIDSALQVLDALGYSVPKAGPINVTPFSIPAATQSGNGVIPPGPPLPRPKPAGLCGSGCESTLGALRRVRQYSSSPPFGCPENVYVFPKGWPGDDLFLHVAVCPGLRGSASPVIRIGFAATDSSGDADHQLGLATLLGSTGSGFLRLPNGERWKLSLKNPHYGGPANVNDLSIAVQAY